MIQIALRSQESRNFEFIFFKNSKDASPRSVFLRFSGCFVLFNRVKLPVDLKKKTIQFEKKPFGCPTISKSRTCVEACGWSHRPDDCADRVLQTKQFRRGFEKVISNSSKCS